MVLLWDPFEATYFLELLVWHELVMNKLCKISQDIHADVPVISLLADQRKVLAEEWS